MCCSTAGLWPSKPLGRGSLGNKSPKFSWMVDIDTLFSILFTTPVSLTPPFRQLFAKRVERKGFLSSDWLNVVVN